MNDPFQVTSELDIWVGLPEGVIEPGHSYDLFMSSQPAQKNQLLKMVLANLEVKDAKLIWKLKNFFEGILKANASQDWLPRLDKFRTLNWGQIRKDLEFSGLLGLRLLQDRPLLFT